MSSNAARDFDQKDVSLFRSMRLLGNNPLRVSRLDGKLVLAHMYFAFVALLIGGVAGLLQSMERSGRIELPGWLNYYELLTAHGVLMALVFTTFFIIGFLYAGMSVTTGGELAPGTRLMGWIGFLLMAVGVCVATVPILLNKASVLYTFYAPMKAAPAFYIGLTLVVVGSWVSGWGIFMEYAGYSTHKGYRSSPLFTFMAVTTMLVWQIATLGVAAEVLLQLIPWSLGWTPVVNVLLSRTLFWFFGHPLVYFWLLPAYMAWYLVMPRLIGGKVFSDPLARMSFLMLLVFSIPVGLHHQLMEPGLEPGFKAIQVGLTLAVAIPSLMTAFSLFATMERAGRARGFTGLFGWLRGLPWKDARFLALFMGMVVFIPGGAGGIINASLGLNALVHNTLWITGHFHLTVATACALTFCGVAFWLVPHASGRVFTRKANKVALVQVWLWTIGMGIMSTAMHIVGLFGAPRRTSYVKYSGDSVASSWDAYAVVASVGGTLLFVSVLLAVGLVFYLGLYAPKGESEFLLADAEETSEQVSNRLMLLLERWRVWLGVIVVLIIAAYGVPIGQLLTMHDPGSPPLVTWGTADQPKSKPTKKGNSAGEIKSSLAKIEHADSSRSLFSQTCASCHELSDAKSSGAIGPVLNNGAYTADAVLEKIEKGGGSMPAGLLKGADAEAVAEYVAVASGGEAPTDDHSGAGGH